MAYDPEAYQQLLAEYEAHTAESLANHRACGEHQQACHEGFLRFDCPVCAAFLHQGGVSNGRSFRLWRQLQAMVDAYEQAQREEEHPDVESA